MTERIVRIGSSHGLHARPAKLFAQAAKEAGIPVTIAKDSGKAVNAASILGVIALGIEHGDHVIHAGDDQGGGRPFGRRTVRPRSRREARGALLRGPARRGTLLQRRSRSLGLLHQTFHGRLPGHDGRDVLGARRDVAADARDGGLGNARSLPRRRLRLESTASEALASIASAAQEVDEQAEARLRSAAEAIARVPESPGAA